MIEGRGLGKDGKPVKLKRPDQKREDKKNSFGHEPVSETAKNVMIALSITEE